jgi:cytochrome bd-type quinol oxidase subunit 2
MKLMNQKNKKFAKIFTVLFTIAVVTSLTALTAFAAGGAGGGSEAAYKSTIEFFITWIRRIGMMVAFVGAIMFALAIKNNDAEQKQAGLITMIAGFIVAALCAASSMFDLFT